MTPTAINYTIGDATDPVIKTGERFIIHVCNDQGGWGSGFVVALSKKWPEPEADYRSRQSSYVLGTVRCVFVEHDTYVLNLIGQHKTGRANKPVRYDAINDGLNYIGKVLRPQRDSVSVHMPRIGCGLAGGDWRIVSAIIESTLCDRGIEVYVYDLPGQPFVNDPAR